jgi:serpin B
MGLLRRALVAFPFLGVFGGCKTGAAPSPAASTAPASAPPPAQSVATNVTPAGEVSAEDRAADADGERGFVARLYGAVSKSEPGNLFVSPSSARSALGMVLGGASPGSTTERELTSLLGATPRTHDVAAVLAREWAALGVPPGPQPWEKDDTITLRTANRLFGAQGRAFVPAFVELTGHRYGAPIEAVDFANAPEAAQRRINEWVAGETADRIKNILAQPPAKETKLALANALYFKAAWRDAFTPERTKPETFFAPGGPVTTPMMSDVSRRRYGETADAQIVELPYGGMRRGDIAMVLVVPKRQDGLAALERSIDADALARWFRAPSDLTLVDLALPRFRIDSSLTLTKTLAELGAPSAFEYGKADFSGIDGTKELFLGLVIQKTFVAVDEKGTEAAAATVVMAPAGAAPQAPPKPVVVRADRPFLFFIRDVTRNRTLFVGRLEKPASAR